MPNEAHHMLIADHSLLMQEETSDGTIPIDSFSTPATHNVIGTASKATKSQKFPMRVSL
jgi:hypothetical protein